jgi:hypothetical protein
MCTRNVDSIRAASCVLHSASEGSNIQYQLVIFNNVYGLHFYKLRVLLLTVIHVHELFTWFVVFVINAK